MKQLIEEYNIIVRQRPVLSKEATQSIRYEIDLVALKLKKGQVVVAEVKRQKKNFQPALLAEKVEHLKHKASIRINFALLKIIILFSGVAKQ